MTDSKGLWSTIKDHPVFIVIGFCAATAGAVAALYEKVIIPYQLKIQEVKIADLTRQLAQIPDKDKVIAEREKLVADREAEITSLRKNLADSRQHAIELSQENIFSPDDPYPKVFRRVRIGGLLSSLESAYPGSVTREDEESLSASVSIENFFFSSVTFFSLGDVKPYRVHGLIFHLNSDPDPRSSLSSSTPDELLKKIKNHSPVLSKALHAQLVERYGPGKLEKRSTIWNVRGVVLELTDAGLLSITKP